MLFRQYCSLSLISFRIIDFLHSSSSVPAQRRLNIVHPRGSTMGSGYHQVASSPDRGSIVSKCGDQKQLCDSLVSNGPSLILEGVSLCGCVLFCLRQKEQLHHGDPGCRSGEAAVGAGFLSSFPRFLPFLLRGQG